MDDDLWNISDLGPVLWSLLSGPLLGAGGRYPILFIALRRRNDAGGDNRVWRRTIRLIRFRETGSLGPPRIFLRPPHLRPSPMGDSSFFHVTTIECRAGFRT